MWQDIRAIRECRAGLQPVQCCSIKKKDGELCVEPAKTLSRWREHFEGVLNVISTFYQSALDEVRQLPLRSELAEPPNEDDILEALGQLAVGKAGDMNGLLPDVLKCCGGPFARLYCCAVSDCLGGETCALRVERCFAGPCAQERRFVLLR